MIRDRAYIRTISKVFCNLVVYFFSLEKQTFSDKCIFLYPLRLWNKNLNCFSVLFSILYQDLINFLLITRSDTQVNTTTAGQQHHVAIYMKSFKPFKGNSMIQELVELTLTNNNQKSPSSAFSLEICEMNSCTALEVSSQRFTLNNVWTVTRAFLHDEYFFSFCC